MHENKREKTNTPLVNEKRAENMQQKMCVKSKGHKVSERGNKKHGN